MRPSPRLVLLALALAIVAIAAFQILLLLGVGAATAGIALLAAGVPLAAISTAHFLPIVEAGPGGINDRHPQILEKILESMADGLLVVDGAGETIYANKELVRLFGDRHVIGSPEWQKIYRRFLPDGKTPFPPEETPIGRAMRGEPFDNLEIVMRNDILKEVRLLANGRPIMDTRGNILGAVIVYRDITQEWETARQLQHAQRIDAVGQLTGGIAHDFNNILTVVRGSIELLGEKLAGNQAFAPLISAIDDATDRGAGLTSQLLAFARKQTLQPREIDINAMLADVEKLVRRALGEHIEIESITKRGAWQAHADPNQLTTALLNLAINARDAMPGGGKLTLETDNVVLDQDYADQHAEVSAGDHVMIAVTDTGSGIPAAIRDKVFEPFFTTKDIGKGTGLGLSMVYGFVKQSRGHISLYSEEGQGTTFKIYLPRADAAAARLAPAAFDPTLSRGSETVLVVEDDELVRNNVVLQLQDLGYRTIPAATPDEALRVADETTPFELLLTDVVMPGMNGSALASLVTQRRPAVKVLYTSGYTENAMIHQGQLMPGVHLLEKPYRKSDLARLVRTALDTPAEHPAGAV